MTDPTLPNRALDELPAIKREIVAALATGDILRVETTSLAALAIDCGDAEVWCALGISLLNQGRKHESQAAFRRAAAVAPDYADSYVGHASPLLSAADPARTITWLRRALALNPDSPAVHTSLAHTLLPGDDHYALLNRLHAWLRPSLYLEIGVRQGRSIALARSPTIAIGIDPQPQNRQSFTAATTIHSVTSDAYFDRGDVRRYHEDLPVDLAFIDGLHLFEQSLRDFINVERIARKDAIILLHDCIPLDSITAGRVQRTQFYTGDVWKTVLCLKDMRPDLVISLIEVPPTGMAIVGNLDPTSAVLGESYRQTVSRYVELDLRSGMARLRAEIDRIPNDWSAVKNLLQRLGRSQATGTPA